MKIYVVVYEPKEETEEEKKLRESRPGSNPKTHDIYYNVTPHWTMDYGEVADVELRILQNMNVRVGQHYCKLEVEELREGRFAIVCNDHPDINDSRMRQ